MTEEKEKVNRPLDTMDEIAYRELEQHYSEAKRTIENLEARLAELLEVDATHQKLNGKLQERLAEVEEDNKKLADQIEDKINQMRRSGM